MASREGYDLFTKMGRKHFRRNRNRNWKYVWRDTFAQIGCLIVGHNTYKDEEDSIACHRCGKYIKSLDGKE